MSNTSITSPASLPPRERASFIGNLIAEHFLTDEHRQVRTQDTPWRVLVLGDIANGCVLHVFLPESAPKQAIIYTVEWLDANGTHQCERVDIRLAWNVAHNLHLAYRGLSEKKPWRRKESTPADQRYSDIIIAAGASLHNRLHQTKP